MDQHDTSDLFPLPESTAILFIELFSVNMSSAAMNSTQETAKTFVIQVFFWSAVSAVGFVLINVTFWSPGNLVFFETFDDEALHRLIEALREKSTL